MDSVDPVAMHSVFHIRQVVFLILVGVFVVAVVARHLCDKGRVCPLLW